jgi:hypothetical protein
MLGSDGMRRPRSRLRLVGYGPVARHWDFNPRDVERLDAAHARVLAAAERAGRRMARRKDRERLAEAEAAERAVLSWIGVTSWLEYRLRAAGVTEIEDILAVVDLTRPRVVLQSEPATAETEAPDWQRLRPLLRQARG